jgi:hypothetical protein
MQDVKAHIICRKRRRCFGFNQSVIFLGGFRARRVVGRAGPAIPAPKGSAKRDELGAASAGSG